MTLAPRPEALGAETKYLEERLRSFRDRISIVSTDEESWRLLRACDALAAVSARLSGGTK